MLLAKSAHPHLNGGVTAVHVVFDSSGLLLETTKEIEHKRGDNTANDLSAYQCISVNSLFQAHGGEVYLLVIRENLCSQKFPAIRYFLVEHAREPHTT